MCKKHLVNNSLAEASTVTIIMLSVLKCERVRHLHNQIYFVVFIFTKDQKRIVKTLELK